MSWTIHKYPVGGEHFVLELPEEAVILDVQLQRSEAVMWVWLDDEAEKVPRDFGIFGTGGSTPSPDVLDWIGTYQTTGGTFVWHLFEYL